MEADAGTINSLAFDARLSGDTNIDFADEVWHLIQVGKED